MPPLQHILQLIIIHAISLIIGIVSLGYLAWRTIVIGPRRMFSIDKYNTRPPALKDDSRTIGEHGFIRLTNRRIKLHYVASGPKDKPLMLFVHGFPEFWYSWRHQLKEFRKEYRVVAFDMRGYGDSDKPTAVSDYVLTELANDIEQMITGLGYENCILVGHDWGGAVTWVYAVLHPERVTRLIVCNCPHPAAFEKFLRSSLKQTMKSWYMFFFQVPILPELFIRADDFHFLKLGFNSGSTKQFMTSEDLEAYKYTFANHHDICAPINFYRSMMRYRGPSLKRRIQVPTLVIWGTKDAFLETKTAELSGNYVENFTLRLVDGCSHWVQQEEPEEVNRHIREFLAESFSATRSD